MSHYKSMMIRIKATAQEIGVAELAKRANVDERTMQRLLKKPPKASENLRRLDEVAETIFPTN